MILVTAFEEPADRTAAASSPARASGRVCIAGPSGGSDLDRLDDVAHVARGLPQRLHGLALARAVPGAHAQVVHAGGRHQAERELAERVAPQVLAQRRFAPGLVAIGGAGELPEGRPPVG